MKTLLFFFAVILFGCSGGTQQGSAESGTDKQYVDVIKTDTVYLVRNQEISPSNSYSDLFTDSSYVDRYMKKNNFSEDDMRNFRSFYNYRNFQYAWFSSLGLTEPAKGFWNLQDEVGSKASKELKNKMDSVLNNDSLTISRFDSSYLDTELSLTKAYLDFYKSNRSLTHLKNFSPETFIPVKKMNTLTLADSMLARSIDTATAAQPSPYALLRARLKNYVDIAKRGGWQQIGSSNIKSKAAAGSPVITQVKKRLMMTGEYPGQDSSSKMSDSLVSAIKLYQLNNGFKPTGTITDSLIRNLNIPVEQRIQQMILNLQRMQWMPAQNEPNYLAVNIPSFTLTVYENNSKVFDMPVAVGKEGTHTTMFSGDMNQVVFSPYWNIPASIVKNEILPKIKADPNYLKSRKMEIVGKNDSLPTIRQLPGAENSLGRVKFLFPNRYDIYLHDTYAKEIFNKEKRTISHGCIRLQDAKKLATYLLRNDQAWTPEKINTAMNSGKEQFVKLEPTMPVIVTYYTAWVDEAGNLQFRDDVYGNDRQTALMSFQ